jgi:hypothetical protein
MNGWGWPPEEKIKQGPVLESGGGVVGLLADSLEILKVPRN